jgi:hypothetical protein
MPSTTAMRRCAELVFVPPRFDIYRAVSRQIHAILSHYTALIEPLSLDEAYLDVTQDLRGLQTASATAREIRARILQETGLTASAGISYSGESLQGSRLDPSRALWPRRAEWASVFPRSTRPRGSRHRYRPPGQ